MTFSATGIGVGLRKKHAPHSCIRTSPIGVLNSHGLTSYRVEVTKAIVLFAWTSCRHLIDSNDQNSHHLLVLGHPRVTSLGFSECDQRLTT